MTLKTPSPKKTAAKKKIPAAKLTTVTSKKNTASVSYNQRHRMIATAAYLLAEQRNFQGDQAIDDWLQAETEVDARLKQKH